MKAVVLAGGLGTRLHPLTCDMPKPMALVGNRPLIDITIEKLVKAGFEQILVTTNFMASAIERYLRYQKYPVPVICFNEKTALGTAGSVKSLEKFFTGTFAVIPGDGLAEFDLSVLAQFHREKRSAVTLGLSEVLNPQDYGIVRLDDRSRIIRFREKPGAGESSGNLANNGYYFIEPEILKYVPSDRPYDFGRELFPQLLKTGVPLYGMRLEGFWADIGSVEKYLAANRWFLKHLPSSVGFPRYSGDSSILIEPGTLLAELSTVGKGVLIGEGTAVGRRVTIGPYTVIRNSIIYPDTKIGAGCRIFDSIIGENSRIQDGVIIRENCILGRRCCIGQNAQISAGSRIGSDLDIPPQTVVRSVKDGLTAGLVHSSPGVRMKIE